MKYHRIIRILAIFLSLTLFISSIPLQGFAKETEKSGNRETTVKDPDFQPFEIEGLEPGDELVNERTKDSKVFYNGNESYTQEFYFEPIHAKEEGGEKFEEISPELIENSTDEKLVETENTILQSSFLKEMENGLYATFEKDGHTISYALLEASGDGKDPIKANDVTATYDENKILHQAVFPEIDLRNLTFGQDTKEDLILHSYQGYHTFSFQINTNLTAKEQEDRSIHFLDDREQTIFQIAAPFMEDSNYDEEKGEAERSDQVKYELQQIENGYLLKVVADQAWLTDPERKYPVYIDPTTSINASTDTFVMSAYPTTNYNASTSKWDSGQSQYVLKTGYYDSTTGTNYAFLNHSLDSLKGTNVTEAQLKVFVTHAYYASQANGLWLDTVNSSWSASTLTWNNKPSSTNIGTVNVARDQWATFNVTDAVKNWVNGSKTNYGFKLHTNGNGKEYWKKVVSSTNSTSKPYLSVTYTVPTPTAPSGAAYSNGDDTGYVNLSWSQVGGAVGYKVWIYNGKEYEAFSVGNVTSWSTKGKNIWPTEADIKAGKFDLYQDGKGTELSVDPSPVYKNSGGNYSANKNYWFRISAIYPSGESTYSQPFMPTIVDLDKPSTPNSKSFSYGNGTGYVDVSWQSVEGATGYKIYLFNGKSYESMDVGNVTTWSTKGKKIWPTETEISKGQYALHLSDQKGSELPVDPSDTYKIIGYYPDNQNYWIRVSAYNEQGETAFSDATRPTISSLPQPLLLLDLLIRIYWINNLVISY
ncbi:DNRLRE domain-containing protein [Bacillus carboniphilus]|uniref:DNRLRE domain-containing protein n=1 Tax=Bacillus carboniphilus TaxID=86663 RepID=A0ABY9JXD3_9BACI|nr:DNRLRE domain-containing protein [Bacillus carboniphilus]WLR43095.1 DNRLRE domain-containing protein [Bacillus carboniphilus]